MHLKKKMNQTIKVNKNINMLLKKRKIHMEFSNKQAKKIFNTIKNKIKLKTNINSKDNIMVNRATKQYSERIKFLLNPIMTKAAISLQ